MTNQSQVQIVHVERPAGKDSMWFWTEMIRISRAKRLPINSFEVMVTFDESMVEK